jgi:hypothetical protein
MTVETHTPNGFAQQLAELPPRPRLAAGPAIATAARELEHIDPKPSLLALVVIETLAMVDDARQELLAGDLGGTAYELGNLIGKLRRVLEQLESPDGITAAMREHETVTLTAAGQRALELEQDAEPRRFACQTDGAG